MYNVHFSCHLKKSKVRLHLFMNHSSAWTVYRHSRYVTKLGHSGCAVVPRQVNCVTAHLLPSIICSHWLLCDFSQLFLDTLCRRHPVLVTVFFLFGANHTVSYLICDPRFVKVNTIITDCYSDTIA